MGGGYSACIEIEHSMRREKSNGYLITVEGNQLLSFLHLHVFLVLIPFMSCVWFPESVSLSSLDRNESSYTVLSHSLV